MAYNNVDRFGNPYKVVGLKPNKNGFPVGYITIGNTSYKIEISHAKKDGVDMWCKVTKMPTKKNNWNGGF